jgi:methylmalonyl-CoA mutase cobalamin-binding subunit
MTTDRPVRILLAILGLDQHEAGAFAVSTVLPACRVIRGSPRTTSKSFSGS